jgi:hypothetical protein
VAGLNRVSGGEVVRTISGCDTVIHLASTDAGNVRRIADDARLTSSTR